MMERSLTNWELYVNTIQGSNIWGQKLDIQICDEKFFLQMKERCN